MIQAIEYSVCIDCVMYIANDELENKTQEEMNSFIERECSIYHNEGKSAFFVTGVSGLIFSVEYLDKSFNRTREVTVRAENEDAAKAEVMAYDDEDDIVVTNVKDVTSEFEYQKFSYSKCELCRSNLGGSRHPITLIVQGE